MMHSDYQGTITEGNENLHKQLVNLLSFLLWQVEQESESKVPKDNLLGYYLA